MKRVVIGILISLVMIGSVLANATVVNNDVEFEDGKITISIEIGDFEIENNGDGIDINVENFGHYLVAGKPNLPSRIFQIAIPPGSEFVDMTFSTSEGVVLPDSYYVLPCKLPQVIGKEDPFVHEKEEKVYQENYESIYNSDEAYPSSNVEFVRTGGFRKYNLVDVRVIPFSYKPLSGELTYFHEFSIIVSYTYPEGFSPENIMYDNILETEKKAEQIVYNYNQAKDWYPTGESGKQVNDYVIITLDSLTSSIQPLVVWEETKGKSVYVATTEWIDSSYSGYDLAEKMRNFLLEKYPSDEWGILDVCLIGSYDDVPIRLTAQDAGYGRPETDYYYAELSFPDSQSWDADEDHQYGENSDPIDFTAEVNVGRIPWSDPDTVEHIIQKSIAFEQNDDPAYKKNILLIGTFFWSDTDNAVLMEYKTDPELHPWMEDWTRTTMYEEAESSYECDYDVSYAKVEEVWSEGSYAFVDWAGHGSPTACYELYPSQPFVDTSTCLSLNDDYPAIIFADACSNSDTDYDNIGQMMLKQGAVGFLGSTKVAYGMHAWNDPLDGSTQSLDYWFTTCCTSGEYTQGEAHQYALYQMYINDLWYYQKLEAFEWGALWGNPDLTMGTVVTSDPPAKPYAPEGPAKGAVGYEYIFSSETTDPNGDQIYYMFDWGDGDFSEWTGPFPSGETGKASHIWNDEGYFDISVKARDEYGAQSEWSEATTFELVYNNPPDKPKVGGPIWLFPKVSYKFDFSTSDPDDEDVFYWIDWGDGEMEEWIGPYSSGEEFTLSHSYNEKGSYYICVKAKDTMDIESGLTERYIKVSFSRNRVIINPFLQRIIQILFNQLPLFK